MDEELIDYLFEASRKEGFKRNREDFVKYLQSDDELFDYLYGKAQKEGYKKDKNHFAGLMGRTQKVVPTSTEPVVEETTTDYSKVDTTPMDSKSVESIQVKDVEEPTVDKVDLSDKEKADRLKDVTEAKKNAMAEDISSKLMPVTEKTQVKEVTKAEPVKEMKGNTSISKPITVNGIKIDDNINLGTTFFPISKRGDLHKLANTKDLTLNEIVDKFTSKYNVGGMGSTVVLDKNISLNFPDPPNVKTKNSVDQNDENIFETKIEGKNIYSYFDDKNNKWYTYTKGSNKENWTEVKSPPIKQILNTKYKDDKGEIDKSKIFKITEEEADKILKIKEHYFYNRYLPYIVSNYDQLNQPQKEKVKSFLNTNFFNQKISRDIYNEWYKESDNPDINTWGEKYDNFWEHAVKKIGLDINLEKEKSSKKNYLKKQNNKN